MKYVAKIGVTQAFADEMGTILGITEGRHPDYKDSAVIATVTAQFDNGYQADIKVCNGDTPYVDNVLFDKDGDELHCPDISESLLGQYEFEHDGDTFEVDVMVMEHDTSETYYQVSKHGYSIFGGEPVLIIGERSVNREGDILEQYIYNIVGYEAKNGKPFIALKPNIAVVEGD